MQLSTVGHFNCRWSVRDDSPTIGEFVAMMLAEKVVDLADVDGTH